MNHSQEYYIPHLEWEFSDFPIKIHQLKFEKTDWGFIEEAVIEVWRDEQFRLRGKIYGVVAYFKKTNEKHFIGKGNIIKGQIIKGVDTSSNIVELRECYLVGIHTNSEQKNEEGYFTEGELILDAINIQFSKPSEPKEGLTRFDWFLCSKIEAHFWEVTFRKSLQKKVRVGIDKHDDSIENLIGSSSSKDYTTIKLPDIEFIVAKVPATLLPNQIYGLCLEFRDNLDKINDDLISGISHFISFLLGSEIKHMGHSFVDNEMLIESYLQTINNRKLIGSMPPIKFNLKYEWGDISWLLNQLLPKYLEMRKQLPLDEALSRYWIARNIPVGSNLPVLASAVEIIAEKYLKQESCGYQNGYISQEEYLKLIKPEITELKSKLSSIKGGDIILNKILGDFRKGPNEKMNHFFSAIGIELGKLEKKAIALRNKMAHASRDYSDENRVQEDLIFTRIYEVLFHRTILKLLDYNGYYIDYSIKGCPLKYIDKPAGK
jgi:hypothetical protein